MARYKPGKEFNTPMLLYLVTGTENVLGVEKKIYSTQGILFWGSFATYGGTESVNNGLVTVADTAKVETWYRPEFAASANSSYACLSESLKLNLNLIVLLVAAYLPRATE